MLRRPGSVGLALALVAVAVLTAAQAAEAAKPQAASHLEIPFQRAVDSKTATDRARRGVGAGNPAQKAREYLRHAAGRLGLDPDLSDLERTAVRTGASGAVVRFRQHVEGIPVYGADLSVKLDREGQGTQAISSYRGGLAVARTQSAISESEARAAAFDHLGVDGDAPAERTEMVVFPGKGRGRLAYQVDVMGGGAPAGDWRVLVDAATGEVFGAEDRAVHVDGSATVFDPDPLSSAGASYGDPGFVDGGDADTPQLSGELFPRTLREVTEDSGTFKLVGPWASCQDWDVPFKGCFAQASPDWRFSRGPDAFEAANTYYAIDTYMRYLNEDLGLGITPYQYAGGVRYDPHGAHGADNSFYSLFSGRLSLGEGGVDDAEDADVIIHELGHGLHDWVTGGSMSQIEGLSEGVGDFAAAEYSRSFGQWTPADDQYHWVFDWDGHNPFWGGRVTNWTDSRTYPNDQTGMIHTDGQFWSSCNMQVWDAIGRDATVRAHWEGLAMTNSSTDQQGAAQAVIQAALDLGYDDATVGTIAAIYRGCGYEVQAPGFMSGGGQFDPDGTCAGRSDDRAGFSGNAGGYPGDPSSTRGHFNYVNHCTRLRLAGPVTAVLDVDHAQRRMTFEVTDGPCVARVTWQDVAEPGGGQDAIELTASGDGCSESQSRRAIGAGNVRWATRVPGR